jgi:hypothetical protein
LCETNYRKVSFKITPPGPTAQIASAEEAATAFSGGESNVFQALPYPAEKSMPLVPTAMAVPLRKTIAPER